MATKPSTLKWIFLMREWRHWSKQIWNYRHICSRPKEYSWQFVIEFFPYLCGRDLKYCNVRLPYLCLKHFFPILKELYVTIKDFGNIENNGEESISCLPICRDFLWEKSVFSCFLCLWKGQVGFPPFGKVLVRAFDLSDDEDFESSKNQPCKF